MLSRLPLCRLLAIGGGTLVLAGVLLFAAARQGRADGRPAAPPVRLGERYRSITRSRCPDLLASSSLPPLTHAYESYAEPRRLRDWLSLGATVGITGTGIALLASGDADLIDKASDVGQFLNPAVAFGLPVANGDWRGAAQFGLSFATTMGLVFGMKNTVEKRRPQSSAPGSFPSGHTAAAFSGASFLATHYGPWAGVPAYAVALYTGLARVAAARHYLDDVIAGAGIALITNWLWALPFGGGCDRRLGRSARRSWRVEFAFGTIWQADHEVSYPEDVGTEILLTEIEGTDDLLAAARVSLHWYPIRRFELMLRIDPAELRGSTTLTEPLHFGDTVFDTGSEVFIRWLGSEYKLRGRYEFLPRAERWSLQAGATAMFVQQRIEIYDSTHGESGGGTRSILAPHVHAGFGLSRKLWFLLSADGIPYLDDTGFDFEAALRWYLPCAWDVGLVYRWSRRPTGGQIDSDPKTQGLYLAIGRSF